jgi:dihydropteroate synthase
MIWKAGSRAFDLSRRPLLMGVLNVTPDSFSDGGAWDDPARASARAVALCEEGAEIVDVGGESTRPGALPVSEEEELRRVIPVVGRLAGKIPAAISIDTSKPGVARAAVAAGAEIVNDVTGLRDPAMRELVAESGAGAVVMHMRGEPRTMQEGPSYGDVVAEVGLFFRQRSERCVASGIGIMQLAFDPGIGFGKTLEHNLALLRGLAALRVPGRPLVVGVSRKSFLARISGAERPEDRDWPTAALTCLLRESGAEVFRVHDVRKNALALRMTEAIGGRG